MLWSICIVHLSLESLTEVYYEVRQVLKSVRDCYHELCQLLQSVAAIAKWDVTPFFKFLYQFLKSQAAVMQIWPDFETFFKFGY